MIIDHRSLLNLTCSRAGLWGSQAGLVRGQPWMGDHVVLESVSE